MHHEALIHSIDGDFTHDPKSGRPRRLKSGGHGQASMVIMDKNGIKYEVIKNYENGVRAGNVPDHKNKRKQTGVAQTWFPESWTARDIVRAGEYVVSLKSNQGASDGTVMRGTYRGVRVGVIKTNGQIATVFPDEDQGSVIRRRRS